ncbi:MAG: hypothetical protein LBM66_00425, partial [Bifidobacteriaceae bacterium]|nr:hypothetical protein [Bifidobacteriaceae bacterium]
LVVAGQELAGVSAFLLAATGRLATDAGDLKTLGLVLPERASKVRRRAAYLDAAQLDGATAEAVEGAVHDGVGLIALDHTETLADSGLRGRVRRELAAAGARGVAVVLGAVGDAAALGEAEALLDGPARVLELAPAAGDPDGTAGVTSPGAARKTGRSASDASGPAHHTSSDDSKKRVLA